MPETAAHARPSPIPHVLAVTFLLSIGTGALTHGLGFIAENAAEFTRTSLFGLGVTFGIAYVLSSRLTGPVMRKLERGRRGKLSPKAMLALITLLGALVSCVPLGFVALDARPGAGLWIVAGGYGLLTGIMWPLIEWNLAGGRRERALRSAAGQFNIVWTLAVVIAFWLIGPTLERQPLTAFAGIAVVHLIAIGLMLPFPSKPPKHIAEATEEIPQNAQGLLTAARTLLPVSYTLAGVLGPFFPIAMQRMGIDLFWQTFIVSVWMTTRIPTMVVLERWHGWHGRAWPLALGGLCVGLGFAGCILIPSLGDAPSAVPLLVLALAVFGAGKGLVYTAAIYYAMEVGQGEVDSGATHEALIGVGYTLGPGAGLIASILVTTGVLPESAFATTLLGVAIIGSFGLAGAITLYGRGRASRRR